MSITPSTNPQGPEGSAKVPPSPAAVARLALWLGLIGFGGGYAVLAQLRRLVVEGERWLDEGAYADAVAVAQSLPGSTGANFFTLLGLGAGGLPLAMLATALFLLPSALLMVLAGVFYDRLRGIQQIGPLFAGMNAAMVGVVASVAIGLGRNARRRWQIVLALVVAGLVELGVGVLEIVLLSIAISLIRHKLREPGSAPSSPLLSLSPGLLFMPHLAVVFLRIGAGTFGGGMAMIPMLKREVVDTLGWMSASQLADAVTLGQITPGPVAITTTFVGFRVAGLLGALVATTATFLPAFIASVLAGRSLHAVRDAAAMNAIFAGLAPVVVGIVGAAAISLARSSVHGPDGYLLAAASFLALSGLRAPPLVVLALAAGVNLMIA